MNSRMILLVVGLAVVLAFACGLILLNFPRDTDVTPEDAAAGQVITAPAGPQVVLVGFTTVTLETDPAKAVTMPGAAVPEVVQQPTLPPDLATATPEGQQPPPVEQPTQPPQQAAPPPSQPLPAATDSIIFIQYTVQQGDTLYGIAAAQNSAIELMALHGIDADDLSPGNVLTLPIANPAFCPGSRAYVVRDKDTAYRIAKQFNTSAEVIRQMNNLDATYALYVTQVICVP